MNCFRRDAVIWPHLYGTIGSQLPWHCSSGVSLLPITSCTGDSISMRCDRYEYCMRIEHDNVLTAGNLLCKGSHEDIAIIPAKGSGNVRALNIASAPPWLNPPRTMRFVGIPAATSSAINEWTIAAALRIPSSSSGPVESRDRRSNLHAHRTYQQSCKYWHIGCVRFGRSHIESIVLSLFYE